MHQRICGSTFIYPGRSLDDGMLTAKRFGFDTVDVGIGGINGHIYSVDAAEDPARMAERVRTAAECAGLRLHECFSLNFGPPMNDPSQVVRRQTRQRFAGLCRFARTAGFEGIMLIPGPVHPTLGRQRSLDLAVKGLSELSEIAAEHHLRLDVEADCDSCASTPEAAEEVCQRVSGIRLALDYSHFIYRGFTHDQIERLDRFAGYVHVRQASPGRIVEFAERGTIDLARLLRHLNELGYRGRFGVEYLSCREADDCGVDVARETPRMIRILEDLLTAISP